MQISENSKKEPQQNLIRLLPWSNFFRSINADSGKSETIAIHKVAGLFESGYKSADEKREGYAIWWV